MPSAVEAYVNEHKEELKGNKGDKGDTGPQGPQGEQGPKGESGKITDEEKKEIEENVTNNLTDVINNKQDKLVSSENIKTINNQSILGAGNISISESEKELKSKSVKLTEEVNQIFLETDDFDVCFINVKTNSSTCEYKIIYHNTNATTQYRDYTTPSSSKAQYR